jgi:intron-binding protein aquarius
MSTGELTNANTLTRILSILGDDELLDVSSKLGVVTSLDLKLTQGLSRDFVTDLLVFHLSRRANEVELLHQLSLYPSETMLWDGNLIPHGRHQKVKTLSSESELNVTQSVFPLPKLNLQFLSIYDYLMRNFELYRLETAYEIRVDLVDAIQRMNPVNNVKFGSSGTKSVTKFNGWARMAVPVSSFSMTEVGKPHIGEVVPSRVTCTLEFDVSRFNGDVREEWEALREHDGIAMTA